MADARYGFNFQWMFGIDGGAPLPPDERALDFCVADGFDFARLPMNYRTWTSEFNYFEPNESVLALVDDHVAACRDRDIHCSLNLHRAPGYCITRRDLERHNLWVDEVAQDAFEFLWTTFAERYRGVPADALSFDLVNEPPAVGVGGFDRQVHERIIRRTVAAIRSIDPERTIVIDGLDGGNEALPELTDLDVVHSGRAYQPYPVTHWGATWWDGWRNGDAPRYPGVTYEGRTWDRQVLAEFYAPWRHVASTGTTVHIGEFGCYEQTPNEDALRWFADVLGLLGGYGWGYALWEFEGPFGIIGHRRPGARFERRGGYDVDVDLLDLLVRNRVSVDR